MAGAGGRAGAGAAHAARDDLGRGVRRGAGRELDLARWLVAPVGRDRLAGALISALGIQAMFLCGGLALIAVIVVVRPPLRALWPGPAVESPQTLRPRPGTT